MVTIFGIDYLEYGVSLQAFFIFAGIMRTTLPANITCVLFDFDGVLADTEAGRYETYRVILREYGFDMTSRVRLEELVGLTGDGFLQKFFPEIPPVDIEEIVRRRQELYMNNLGRFLLPYPGAQATVKELRELGFTMALTTANGTEAAKVLLDAIGLLDCFDAVCGREICEDPVLKRKEYGLISAYLGVDVSECVVVEDSPVGVAGAKRAGYYTIAFERFEHPEITSNADIIIHDYNQLRHIFFLEPIFFT